MIPAQETHSPEKQARVKQQYSPEKQARVRQQYSRSSSVSQFLSSGSPSRAFPLSAGSCPVCLLEPLPFRRHLYSPELCLQELLCWSFFFFPFLFSFDQWTKDKPNHTVLPRNTGHVKCLEIKNSSNRGLCQLNIFSEKPTQSKKVTTSEAPLGWLEKLGILSQDEPAPYNPVPLLSASRGTSSQAVGMTTFSVLFVSSEQFLMESW